MTRNKFVRAVLIVLLSVMMLNNEIQCVDADVDTQSNNPFADVLEEAYYYDAVLWAVEEGITTGTSATEFSPDASCKSVEAVTSLWRIINASSDDTDTDGKDVYSEEIVIINPTIPVNAVEYGLSTENNGIDNSKILQGLVNALTKTGGTIYIPAGEYLFSETGTQTIGAHCVKMQSNVNIVGDGIDTVLKPVGQSLAGLDMFYFNEYLDTNEAIYLENCNFENFVIDGAETSSTIYTSAGKGFMFNLFKNCNWKNVIVMNTDGTGFGVDCPIGGGIENCIAINCGKAAIGSSPGASGFGIGFGYSKEEYFSIINCKAYNNKAFGFFFEHQGRYNEAKYNGNLVKEFNVVNCESSGNYYNYGGLQAKDTSYENCVSSAAIKDGYYFENSKNCEVINCISENEANASFVISQSDVDGGTQSVSNIIYKQCLSNNSQIGVLIESVESEARMSGNIIMDCNFYNVQQNTIVTEGTMNGLILFGNVCDVNNNRFTAIIEYLIDVNNSWNE